MEKRTINVGGKLFTSTVKTLSQCALFKEINMFVGDLFVDRSPKYFKVILEGLIYGSVSVEWNKGDMTRLKKEIDYYGCYIKVNNMVRSVSVDNTVLVKETETLTVSVKEPKKKKYEMMYVNYHNDLSFYGTEAVLYIPHKNIDEPYTLEFIVNNESVRKLVEKKDVVDNIVTIEIEPEYIKFMNNDVRIRVYNIDKLINKDSILKYVR